MPFKPYNTRHISYILRWFLPVSVWSVVLSCLALVPPGIIYGVRANTEEFVMSAGLGLCFILPLILLGVFAFSVASGALLVGSTYYAVRTRGHVFPLLVLVGGCMLMMVAPLPQVAVAREFVTNRAEYEAVVKLAQEGTLFEHPTCLHGFLVPEVYRHLTRSCIQGVSTPALALVFDPPTTHRVIIYTQTPEALSALTACCLDGNFYQKVDEHWYFFTPAQD